MKAGLFTKRYHPPGTAPGTLKALGRPGAGEACIHVVDYDAAHFNEYPDATMDTCKASLETPGITWIHLQGHVQPDTLHALGDLLGLHTLALEDVLNVGQRPKFEMYGDQVFIVGSLPVPDGDNVRLEQISIFFGNNYVVSFLGTGNHPFEPVWQRLRKDSGRIRRQGADYLLYCLLDVVIDQGFPVLEHFGERLEQLEEVLLEQPGKSALAELHYIKRELLMLRRVLWPQREVINALQRHDLDIVCNEVRIYFRDCYDHTIQIMDLVETYRDIAAGMLDIYLSSVSHRLNEIMRVLTIIATLFIPPTFIVGLYGMNFDRSAGPLNMPELGWPYGYLAVWGVIILMTVGMLLYFKFKKWF